VRTAPLLTLLIACEPPPAMESNPEVLWLRSRDVVSSATAQRIVQEATAHGNTWAGPLYMISPSAFRGRHLVGHQRLYLREYEPTPGRFRTVDAADDRTMGCASLRRTVELLSEWARRFDATWDLQLGPRRMRLPGEAASIEPEICRNAGLSELAAIGRRYQDRPR
jgi:hypothetical protein